jgi:hypothetical protein
MNEILVYRIPGEKSSIETFYQGDTLWLNQNQLQELFQTDRTSLVKHIKNIYNTGELEESSTCAKIAQVQIEGRKLVKVFFNPNICV